MPDRTFWMSFGSTCIFRHEVQAAKSERATARAQLLADGRPQCRCLSVATKIAKSRRTMIATTSKPAIASATLVVRVPGEPGLGWGSPSGAVVRWPAAGGKAPWGLAFSYSRQEMPVPGRLTFVYRRPFESTPACKPRPPTEKPMPDLLIFIVKPGKTLMRRWKRKPTFAIHRHYGQRPLALLPHADVAPELDRTDLTEPLVLVRADANYLLSWRHVEA